MLFQFNIELSDSTFVSGIQAKRPRRDHTLTEARAECWKFFYRIFKRESISICLFGTLFNTSFYDKYLEESQKTLFMNRSNEMNV
jgi:hypothetical protein